jgi:hypothetical protein
MADFLKIGNVLVNLDHVTRADLGHLTGREEHRVRLCFSDGESRLLDQSYSERFRAYVSLNATEGNIVDLDADFSDGLSETDRA